ncbi:hypothetical protein LPKW2_17285 (plasmid) [Lactiplantibacillus pentosus]|nr:hypothetical protein LPKW2_17285 [Lactiplantibacillus pentosus]
MSKFNLELRIKVVTEYLSGKGSPSLAKKYRISNHAIILVGFIDLSGEVLKV